MRTITWDDEKQVMQMIDQRILPQEFKIQKYDNYHDVADAIQTMVVRGAPAIGVAAAYGMALAGLRSKASTREALLEDLRVAGEVLNQARPTAVNLIWAVRRMQKAAESVDGNLEDIREALVRLAGVMA